MNSDGTYTFKRCDSSEAILKGMEDTKQMMIKEGKWHENITLEEWSNYAGSHVILSEK